MASRTRVAGVVTAAAVAAGAASVTAGGALWRRATARAVARLYGTARTRARSSPARSLAPGPDLPAPVARYLALALPDEEPPIRSVHIRWMGEFQMRPESGWHPFDADQHITTWPPGFVWDARIRVLPLVSLRVRDSYVARRGAMLGRVGGLVPVVDQHDTPEMAAGALSRWLGELVWLPAALLPGARPAEGVRWEAVDDDSARATIMDGGTTASAEFRFAPTGEIVGMSAMRYRDVNGTGVLTPFEGRYHEHARRDGVLVPMWAEVAWLLPEGRFPYWRGRPVRLTYEQVGADDPDAPR